MADIRRLVTLSATGVATTVKDIGSSPYQATRGTTVITPPSANAITAHRERRYGGSQVVGEHHDNGTFAWKVLITGTSVDNMLLNVQALTAIFQSARTDLFFEWRPDGATTSVFYDIAGPVVWKPTYEWAQSSQGFSMYADIEVPFKPLGLLAAQTFAISSSTLPVVAALAGIGGDAPALANITLRTSGGAAPPIWALYGWSQHPGSPLAGAVAPFGIIEAESAAVLSGWALIGSDANYRGSNGVRVATSGAGAFAALYTLDPSVMTPDDFSASETDIEIWARIEIASTVVAPNILVDFYPLAGTAFGGVTYSTPYGSAGKTITLPASGTRFRMVRLGVLSMPINTAAPAAWTMQISGFCSAGSSGNWGLDYLLVVPARQRACSKSGVANDANYPHFIQSTSDTSKTVMGQDLSGVTGTAATATNRDAGIGGSPIEIPPGSVDVLLKLSSLVPDDPTVDATSEQLAHTAVTGSVVVFPRVFLAKGQ